MLTVYRQNRNLSLSCQRHDDMSSCHQRFFIGKRNRLSAFNRCDGRADTDHANHRRNDNVAIRERRDFQQSVHPAYDFDRKIGNSLPKVSRRFLTPHSRDLRMKFPNLFFHQIDILPCCQRNRL